MVEAVFTSAGRVPRPAPRWNFVAGSIVQIIAQVTMPFAPAPDALRTAPRRRGGPPRAWRWGVALAAALVLHGVAGIWFERHRDTFAQATTKPPVEVALLKPQRIAREPARAAARPTPPRRLTAGGEHVLRAVHPDAAAAAPATAALGAGADGAASGAAVASAARGAAAATPVSAPTASPGVKFSVPPSSELRYNTFYNGVQNQPGTIHWTSDGDGYEMVVSVPLPFVGTFSYASRGHIDAFGLAPDRYSERRGRRPEDVTTFDRGAKRIAFTRTPATLALPEGAQDRFSMVMQLASLVRGDPGAYAPGVTREIYVADDDSGETWPIETIGDEPVRTPDGFIEARHFMRLPRRAGDSRRIDVWLASSLGWLPVRIMQTEPNGAQIELVLRGRPAEPGAENAHQSAQTPDDSSAAAPGDEKP